MASSEAEGGDIVGGSDWTSEVCMDEFYKDAVKYWEGIPATVDGMLGGFGHLSNRDVTDSKKFLLPFIEGPEATITPSCVLDCGAGIGRVSKRLLIPLFSEVDLVEQNAAFLEKAKGYIGEGSKKVKNLFPCGLQDFTPEAGRYDIIWCQWVLSHLTDDDLICFLRRCVKGLKQGGLLIAKENVANGNDIFDEDDSSVTRCNESFERIFASAGLTVIKREDQTNFPDNFFQITMFALR